MQKFSYAILALKSRVRAHLKHYRTFRFILFRRQVAIALALSLVGASLIHSAVAQIAPPLRSASSISETTRQGDEAYKRKDYASALKFYTQATEAGDMTAQAALGRMYLFGLGVAQNKDKGLQLLFDSAKTDNVLALKIYAAFMIAGQHKDYEKALFFLRRAADQGDAEAQDEVGSFYATGSGVPEDDTEAVKWFRKSAEQGYAGAELMLGNAYNEGHGVAIDKAQALLWFTKAAEHGDKRAKEHVAALKRQSEEQMTGVPPALKVKCYFMSHAISDVPKDSKDPITASWINLEKNPKYRACVEESIRAARELMR